jgi:hypothetical protein
MPTPDTSPGIPGWFVAVFVLMAVIGVAMAIYRFSVTKSTAESMGVPPGRAVGLALIDDPSTSTLAAAAAVKESLDAKAATVEAESGAKSLTKRLGELDDALAAGVITRSEYEDARKRLIDNV